MKEEVKIIKTVKKEIDEPVTIERPVRKQGKYSYHVYVPNSWRDGIVRVTLVRRTKEE